MTEPAKQRAIGLNHIALEVGDIEEGSLVFLRAPFQVRAPWQE